MRKGGLLWFIGLCLVFLLFAASTQAQVIKLTLAEQNSETSWGPTHAEKPWIKKLEEATKGRVKIDVFYSQTLVKGPDVWNAVKNGVADMGWCMHGYWPDMTPLSDVMTLPALPLKSAEKGSEVFWKLYEKFPAIQKEYKDVQLLLTVVADPRLLITTKKQIKTMEDIKGMKLRILGGPPTEQMKALGAVPLLMPMPDSYQALDKGVIDGMDISWEGIQGFRLYEVVKYYTIAPLTTSYNTVIMNKQKWDSLPKDIQQAISSVSGLEGARFWGKNWYDSVPAAVDEQIRKEGRTMIKYTLPPAETDRWVKVSAEPIWKAWVKKMEGKGVPEAQQILNTTLELLKQ
jgi:TRAP-type C4-dicarboxylate transport system substrate-binding protein